MHLQHGVVGGVGKYNKQPNPCCKCISPRVMNSLDLGCLLYLPNPPTTPCCKCINQRVINNSISCCFIYLYPLPTQSIFLKLPVLTYTTQLYLPAPSTQKLATSTYLHHSIFIYLSPSPNHPKLVFS
jgi:hypothetical protein